MKSHASVARKVSNMRFFKTAVGEYGYGDTFIGVTVPNTRMVARKYYNDIELVDIEYLLNNAIHELRLVALIILSMKFASAQSDSERKKYYTFYFKNRSRINNWDLVDTSAPKIVGQYIIDNPNQEKVLYRLATSQNIWDKRIAIVSTLALIQSGNYAPTVKLSELFLNEDHDLLHKACGWMLREVGKRSKPTLLSFLKQHAQRMPRTMLRYSIEHFSISERAYWMQK